MVEDRRFVYHKGRLLEWWVAAEEYSIIEMEKDVYEHYSWASNQEAVFWYDRHDGKTIRLATNQELLNLLWSSEEVTFIMTVGRFESMQLDGNNNEMLNVVRTEVLENCGPEWAEKPEHGLTTAGPNREEEEEKEHYMDLGFDARRRWPN
jgi:hypothetical protein